MQIILKELRQKCLKYFTSNNDATSQRGKFHFFADINNATWNTTV